MFIMKMKLYKFIEIYFIRVLFLLRLGFEIKISGNYYFCSEWLVC